MRWTRPQIAAALVIPLLAVVWMVYRLTTRTPDLPPETREEVPASAPAASSTPSLQRREPEAPVTSRETTTDAGGRFQLRNLAPGAYRVTFGEPSAANYTTIDGVAVNDIYGANLLNLRMHSSSDGTLGTDEYQPNKLPRLIRGNVVDTGGKPVTGARVRAERR